MERVKITGEEPATGFAYGDMPAVGGLTIRQHFAAMAMQALMSNSAIDIMEMSAYANDAVIAADALIAELNK